MIILVSGSTGNLGRFLTSYLQERGHIVITCNRTNDSGLSFENELIRLSLETKVDHIINATGKYLPDSNPSSYRELETAIVDTARSLVSVNMKWQAPLINFSSYFQYNASSITNYQTYTQMKILSKEILSTSSDQYNFPLTDFVLYDNYGGDRRTKFLESLIDHTKNQIPFHVSNPENKINLVHIGDIAGIVEERLNSNTNLSGTFQIKNSRTLSLRKISEIVTSQSGLKPVVIFNQINSRVIGGTELWDCENDWSPGWNYYKVENFIAEQFTSWRG